MRGRRKFLAGAAAALVAPARIRAQGIVDAEVVIIGAGAAGIAAARRLTHWRHEAIVLEARDRIGGRAWGSTDGLGLMWDRGAQWLHNAQNNPLSAEARALGLSLIWSRFDTTKVTGGADAADALWAAYDALGPRIDRAAARSGPTARYDSLFTGDPWEDAALILSALSIGGDPAQISLSDAAMMESGEDALVQGGPGALVQGLAVGLRVHTGHAVDSIDLTAAGHVTVTGGFGSLRARAVLVTVPPMALAQGAIRVTPSLPPRHLAAFDALGPADVVKVGLRLRKPVPGGAEFAVDPDALLAGQGALLHLDPRAPVASVLIAGAHARALRAEGARAMAAAAQAVLRYHTGQDAIATDSHDWHADPFSAGPWALLRPGADTARHDYIQPIQDRLFFAGEAAPGPWATTLGGAWASGRAAARAIRDAV
jgi:monoamine oxidase